MAAGFLHVLYCKTFFKIIFVISVTRIVRKRSAVLGCAKIKNAGLLLVYCQRTESECISLGLF